MFWCGRPPRRPRRVVIGLDGIPRSDRRARLLALARLPAGGGSSRAVLEERLERMGGVLRGAGFSFAARLLPRERRERRFPAESLRAALDEEEPDLVLCPDGDGSLLERLDRERAPRVGSSAASVALCRSGTRLKRAFEAAEVASPGYFRVRRTKGGALIGLGLVGRARDFPYVVEAGRDPGAPAPAVAFDAVSLAAIVDSALEGRDEVIVERFLGGASSRDFCAATIGAGESALVFPAEILPKGNRPIKAVTREDRERDQVLAVPLEGDERERVGDLARRAFAAAGVRDYARCDLVEAEGRLYALGVEASPRLPDPLFEACVDQAGLGGGRYLAAIAVAALARSIREGRTEAALPSGALALLPEAIARRLAR